MASNNESAVAVRFSKAFADVCDDVIDALQAEHEYGHLDAILVLARALKKKPRATVDDLAKIWGEELDFAVDHAVIAAAIALSVWLGREWYVFLIAHNFRNDCFYSDATTDCLLREARKLLEGWFDEYDKKRAKEREAAMAWLTRQAKKAA